MCDTQGEGFVTLVRGFQAVQELEGQGGGGGGGGGLQPEDKRARGVQGRGERGQGREGESPEMRGKGLVCQYLDAQDVDGDSALHAGAMWGHIGAVQELV